MTINSITLTPIDSDGTAPDFAGDLPAITADVFNATADLYRSVGFETPWLGYLAIQGDAVIGTCGFKSPPADGRVEIAYFTFPGHEGRGLATAMAAELAALAKRHDPAVLIAAQTLPERNASHRILEKLGFTHFATLDHPEDGMVWEWHLKPDD